MLVNCNRACFFISYFLTVVWLFLLVFIEVSYLKFHIFLAQLFLLTNSVEHSSS